MHRYVFSPAVVGLDLLLLCDCLVQCDLETQMTCLVMVWNIKCMGQLTAYLCVLNYKQPACKLKLYTEAEPWRLGGSLPFYFWIPDPNPAAFLDKVCGPTRPTVTQAC